MKRRSFLDAVSGGLVLGMTGCVSSGEAGFVASLKSHLFENEFGKASLDAVDMVEEQASMGAVKVNHDIAQSSRSLSEDRIYKSKHFYKDFADDIFVPIHEIQLLKDVTYKLSRIKALLGYAHFNLVSFDEAIRFAKNSRSMKPFRRAELEFLERIFYENAQHYGFYGEKVTPKLTDLIAKKDAKKIPGTGHYIYQGEPVKLYDKICRELGPTIILTSGIRSIVKQMHLFLAKTVSVGGNLSRASRSLAPPGHSFHGIGDFDVGKRGLGFKNFTNHFATTEEYDQLIKMGFIRIRYVQNNDLGVRFEPWHIKVV